jgi:hypothetical protein
MRARASFLITMAVGAGALSTAVHGGDKIDLSASEKKAITKISEEILKLAEYCAMKRNFTEARGQLTLGLGFDPDAAKLLEARKKYADQADKPPRDFLKTFAVERGRRYADCAKAVAALVKDCDKAGDLDKFELWIDRLATVFPDENSLKSTQAVYFEPYRKWYRKVDHDKLAAGGEQIDGKWLDKKAIDKLDQQHATWNDPWKLSDEIHEIQTNAPYRKAKQLMIHVSSFRSFFLKKFSTDWDLRAPTSGKLEVICTVTQKEFEARIKADGYEKGERENFAGVYMHGHGGKPGPLYVTFEPKLESGENRVTEIDDVLDTLQHELTHQIAFEYSRHAAVAKEGEEYQHWAPEGIAEYMRYYKLGRTGWHLTHPKHSAFEFSKIHEELPQELDGFFRLGRSAYRADYYQVGAAIAHFLHDGEGGRYRKHFIKLEEMVHQGKATAGTFAECFPDMERKVIVFATDDYAVKKAKEAGPLEVGGAELAKKIQGGWSEFDAVLVHPDCLKIVAKLDKILGPRDLMPNEKDGTLTRDLAAAIEDFRKGYKPMLNEYHKFMNEMKIEDAPSTTNSD